MLVQELVPYAFGYIANLDAAANSFLKKIRTCQLKAARPNISNLIIRQSRAMETE